jgi:TolB-like protein
MDQATRLIERIEANGALGSGDRLISLLKYLVSEELAGRGQRIKAFNIATEVFGRSDDFDPQSNSIVRVEVGRLRRALELYFATAGKDEPILIEIGKGGYRPCFVARDEDPRSSDEAIPAPDEPNVSQGPSSLRYTAVLGGTIAVLAILGFAWIWGSAPDGQNPQKVRSIAPNSIEVFELENRTGQREFEALALSLTAEIQSKLGNTKTLQVFATAKSRHDASTQFGAQQRNPIAQHELSGAIVKLDDQLNFILNLTEAQTGTLIWSEAYRISGGSNREFLDKMASQAIFDLRGQIFGSVRNLIERRPTQTASPIELFLLATWFPGFAESSLKWETDRVQLAERALFSLPNFGPAHSVLAEKIAYLANVNPPSDTDLNWNKARSHLRDALQFATDDPDAVFNVALHYWHAGSLEESHRAIKRVLELQAGHPLASFMLEAIPFTCSSAPPETIERLTRFDLALEPGNPIRWVTLGWIARLHFTNANYAEALAFGQRANHVFTSPDAVFLVAASHVHLGDLSAANKIIAEQQKFWPNMDGRHYAEKTVPRRCAAGDRKEEVMKAYQALYTSNLERSP